jgi:hypothetical protein
MTLSLVEVTSARFGSGASECLGEAMEGDGRVEPLVISFGKRFAKRFANWKIRFLVHTHVFLKSDMFHSYVE